MGALENFLIDGLKWLLASLGAVSAYIVNQWRKDHDKLESRVQQIEKTYVERKALDDHVKQLRDEMRAGFERILDKIDGKADKP